MFVKRIFLYLITLLVVLVCTTMTVFSYEDREEMVQHDLYEKRKKEVIEAKNKPVIGRILSFYSSKGSNAMYTEDEPAAGRWVHEGEKLYTVAGERIKLALDDDTRIVMGPSSQIEFKNWNERDENEKRIRQIVLDHGILWLKVSKVYSQMEPFVVVTKPGVVAVKGTEFIVETGEGGHQVQVREQMKGAAEESRLETEVHTLEGEVWVAKYLSDLFLKGKYWRVAVKAGYRSLVRLDLNRPQEPRKFNIDKFNEYFSHAVPDTKLVINRRTSNATRAEEVTLTSFKQSESKNNDTANRSIASVESSGSGEEVGGIPLDQLTPMEKAKAYIKKPESSKNRRKSLLQFYRDEKLH